MEPLWQAITEFIIDDKYLSPEHRGFQTLPQIVFDTITDDYYQNAASHILFL